MTNIKSKFLLLIPVLLLSLALPARAQFFGGLAKTTSISLTNVNLKGGTAFTWILPPSTNTTTGLVAPAIKLANNLVLLCAIQAMGEAFSLVRKYDVQPQVLYDVMTDALFAAPAYKVYGKIIVDQSYDRVGQMALLGLKDANLALAAGEAVGVPLPSGNVWRDRLVGAVAHGDGDKDWAVMALEQARASGLA